MSKKHCFIFGVTLCMGLSGCATTPSNPNVTNASVANAMQEMTTKTPNVIISRVHAVPILLTARISVDGVEVTRLKNGEYSEFYLEPGEHKIKLSYNRLSMQSGDKTTLTVNSDASYAFDVGGSLSGYIDTLYNSLHIEAKLEPMEFQQAKIQLQSCCKKVDIQLR